MNQGDSLKFAVVIPARLASTRLPEKPLVDIGGVPMIVRTWRRSVEAVGADRVWVATDSERIAEACRKVGAQVVATSDSCLTGTDRVAEAAARIDADVFVNVQGDEPLMPPRDILAVIEEAQRHPNCVINGWCRIANEAEYRSTAIPKVIIAEGGRLLYMSRAPVPGSKSGSFRFARRQECVYAFPRRALALFSGRSKKAEHEAIEDIEILRFLEMGEEVRMVELSTESVAVDTPEDLERVRGLLAER